MKFDNYIFRSHMVGKLVSVPKPLTDSQKKTLLDYRKRFKGVGRQLTDKQKIDYYDLETKLNQSKVYSLTNTAKVELSNIVFYERNGRKYSLENKYVDKGLDVEKKSRDLLSDVLGILLVEDNERRSNKWVTGKRDIKNDDINIDIKSSYNFESFNRHLTEVDSEIYLRQQDCYMELWNIRNSILAYVLVDTPNRIINDELRRLDWKLDIFDINGNIRDNKVEDVINLIQQHIYTYESLENFCQESESVHIEYFKDFKEVPKEERVHLTHHKFEKERIEQRNQCLALSRNYMNNLKPLNNMTLCAN